MSTVEGTFKYEYVHRYTLASQFIIGKDVLNISTEVGGHGSRILAQVATSVVEVCSNGNAIEHAREPASTIGNLKYLQGSYEDIPLEDQSIDVVVSFDTFERAENYDEILIEIKRILRPDGLLLFAAMNKSLVSGSNSIFNALNIRTLDFGELHQLLSRHFTNFSVYAQRANISSFIYPIETDSQKNGLRYYAEIERNEVSQHRHDAEVYFFAVASDDTLPTADRVMSVHTNLTASPDGYALYTLMGHLTQIYAELDASRRMLAAMQGSKFWKLRDAWFGVRDRRAWLAALVPPLQKALWSLTYNNPATKYPIPAMKLMTAALIPPIRKVLWGLTYNHLATKLPTPEMTFMNLGYIGGADEPRPTLKMIDEPSRLRIQLYHHVAALVDLTGREVLEIGCGRGGGASYVKRYLGPSSVVGMDLADKAVEFCRQMHRLEGLRFVQGDAENVPFDDQQFDIVINVESSHCYPSLNAFFREVKRVLRPGGHCLYADIMPSVQLSERRRMVKQAGLEFVQERDITTNVLASLDSNTDERVAWEEILASVFGLGGAREWSILPGSMTLDGMRAGTLCYVSMTLRAGQPSVEARR